MGYTVTDGKFKELKEFKEGVLMPLRPHIRVTGIEGSKCSVFRSAMAPLLISFKFEKDDKFKTFEQDKDDKDGNDDGGEDETDDNHDYDEHKKKKKRGQLTDLENDEYYKIIWKNGDGLRRDQLIIQMIHLMDNLLMEVNLDLCLTLYPVLATGLDHGMMEFVPDAPTIGGILEEYGNNITSYLEKMSNGKQQLLALYQDRFIKSLAGYCVITYLLGVGDRHLDNILLTKGGYLFHIDFGYIYGEEPPMKGTISPKIRIIKQMIAVMGGENSTKYKQFRQYIISAYLRLRKMAPLILNLLSLIGQGQMQQVDDDVRFVYSRFSLEINEDLAANELLRIVEEAANSIWTHWMIDAPHNYATKHK